MLGQPISMLVPDVIGFEMKGRLPEGATATDLVLRVTEMLRQRVLSASLSSFTVKGLISCRWLTVPPSPIWRWNTRYLRLLPH